MYKNNSGLIAKIKVTEPINSQCLTEKLAHEDTLLFLYASR